MGNCLVLQEKSVRVMKTDGKIIQYKSPLKVHQVLSEFSHHVIADKLPVVKHLHPNAEMIRGHLYYLLPLPVSPQPAMKKKKTVQFSDDCVEESKQTSGVVRIKLVISKQELQAILGKAGVSVEDMTSQVQKEPTSTNKIKSIDRDGNMSPRGWLPTLESIPEVD